MNEQAATEATDRAYLRERLADALYPTYGQQDRSRSRAIADAVLASLQPELDRLDVLRARFEPLPDKEYLDALLSGASNTTQLLAQAAWKERDRAITAEERERLLRGRLQLLTDEKVAYVTGPTTELLCEEINRLKAEVTAARKYAEAMRNFCSPHGVSVHYADQLVQAMDRAKEGRS